MSLGLKNCLGKKVRKLKQTNKCSFLFFALGPFGERDDQQVFIQKVVPITNKLFVRLSSTGKRYIHVLSGKEAELGLFGGWFPSSMTAHNSLLLCLTALAELLFVCQLQNCYLTLITSKPKGFLRTVVSETHFMMELTKQAFVST